MTPSSAAIRRVLVLFNIHSGIRFNATGLIQTLSENWDVEGVDLYYQESKNPEDGKRKARQAIADGVDTLIVVGGDGMVNTIGAELVGSNVALAVLPAGSGNGFARHFGIPLRPVHAARVLRHGSRQKIDVGFADDRPFFVTASLAWDADLVRGLEKLPMRGIFPYVFAGIYHFFTYEPQDFYLELDGQDLVIEKPLLLTVANLTQFGGGAIIAPDARPDDGRLSLVAVPRMDPIEAMTGIRHLFTGTIHSMPEIRTWKFERLIVKRKRPDPIQVDGELVQSNHQLIIEVRHSALDVIVPAASLQERSRWSIEDSTETESLSEE